jgi:hypothetical protein
LEDIFFKLVGGRVEEQGEIKPQEGAGQVERQAEEKRGGSGPVPIAQGR